MAAKPRIHLIATGGTIAGVATDPSDPSKYTAGVLTAEELITSVPPLKDLAEISVEQLYNLDSKDMTPDHWLGLARATQAALALDEVDGVVITHGTDTMEESAYFLDRVLLPGKPVVFTGAMRPATALSADGPMNLFEAVGVAAHEDFRDIGVVVVMHGEVHAACYVTKVCIGSGAVFTSLGLGPIGRALPPRLSMVPRRDGPLSFELPRIRSLPRVDILTVAAGSSPDLLVAIGGLGARGVVLALPGCGSIPNSWTAAIQAVRHQGVMVVCQARMGSLSADVTRDCQIGWSRPITPVQARVELQLAMANCV